MLHNFIAFTIITITLLSCSSSRHAGSTKAMPGTWQSTPIVIDGDNKDWPSPYPNYDAKAMVAYATSNDAQNLYITMETGDELTQVKILKHGMAITIDTAGHKEAQFTVNYPLLNDNEQIDISKIDHSAYKGSVGKHSQFEQKVNRMMKDANQFSIEGSPVCNGGYVVTQTTPCGIKVRARVDEFKELVYEVVIPLKAIYNREITKADAGKPISVCFAVKGFKAPSTKGSGGNNSSMNGGGMAGAGTNASMRNGTGGGGNIRSSTQDPNQQLYETTKTWKHFTLAFPL